MQTRSEIVIADTSCFILLDNISELELLKSLFGYAITTTTIAQEFGDELPDWAHIKEVKDCSCLASPCPLHGEGSKERSLSPLLWRGLR